MPPCGYNVRAQEHLCAAAYECFEDLFAQVKSGVHKSISAGVNKEIRDLRASLKLDQFKGKKPVRGTFEFMLGIYERVENSVAGGTYPDYESAIRGQLESLRIELGKVHITDGGVLIER